MTLRRMSESTLWAVIKRNEPTKDAKKKQRHKEHEGNEEREEEFPQMWWIDYKRHKKDECEACDHVLEAKSFCHHKTSQHEKGRHKQEHKRVQQVTEETDISAASFPGPYP